MQDVAQQVIGTAREETDAYRQGADRPLGGYLVVLAVFGALVAGAAGLAAASGRRLPQGSGRGMCSC